MTKIQLTFSTGIDVVTFEKLKLSFIRKHGGQLFQFIVTYLGVYSLGNLK